MNYPKVLTGFTALVDGHGLEGVISKVEPPKIKRTSIEYHGGGMLGKQNVETGYEPFETVLTLEESLAEAIMAADALEQDGVSIQVKGNKKSQVGNDDTAIGFVIRGKVEEIDWSSWEESKNSETKIKIVGPYFEYKEDGTTKIKIDTINAIDEWDGTDRAAARRENLGI